MKTWLRVALCLTVIGAVAHPMKSDAFVWIEKEVADTPGGDAREGSAVAMSGDLLVVGAPRLDKPAGDFGVPAAVPEAGGVRIYHRYGGGWTLDQTLFAPTDASSGNAFGASVAVDGDVLIVGEPRYTKPSIPQAAHNGRALIYVRSPSTGKFVFQREIFRLGLSTQYDYSEYGTSVDVVAGASREYAIAIAAPGEDGIDYGTDDGTFTADLGAVLVARLHTTTDGSIAESGPLGAWYILNRSLEAEVGDYRYRAFGNRASFGKDVALARQTCEYSDCDNRFWLTVGAPNSDMRVFWGSSDWTLTRHGSAQVFSITSFGAGTDGSDVWRQSQYHDVEGEPLYLPFFVNSLSITNKDNQRFGSAVDTRIIDPDGDNWRGVELVIGAEHAAPSASPSRTGAAYYYRIYPNDCCLRGVQSIDPDDTDSGEQFFGSRVAFAADRLLIAATGNGFGETTIFEKESADRWQFSRLLEHEQELTGGIAGSADWIAAGAPIQGETATWQRGWQLHITEPEDGAIMLSPPLPPAVPGVFCPPDCYLAFENGRHIQPAAVPNTGYVFQHWTAPNAACDGSTETTCPLVMDRDRTIGATFAFNVFNTRTVGLSIAAGNGSISLHASTGTDITCPEICGGIFEPGTFVGLLAQPANGFEFEGWTGPCANSGGNTCTFQVTTNVQVAAAFRPIEGNRAVKVDLAGTGPASVGIVYEVGFLACDADSASCTISAPADSIVGISACTASGGRFMHWGGACSGSDGVCVLSLDSDKEVTATFEAIDSVFTAGFDEQKVCAPGWFDEQQ